MFRQHAWCPEAGPGEGKHGEPAEPHVLGFPEPVPLDGNVVLLQPGLPFLSCKFSCLFCIYLCQTDDCTHHPGKRTEQNHFIEHYSCCAFFFSFFFPFFPPSSLSHSTVRRFKNPLS